MLTLISLSFFKKVKSVLKMKNKKNKNTLTSCGTAVGTCRSAPGSWRRPALSPEHAVGHGGRRGTTPDVHFSKILIRLFIFRKS
jgi:hypothetical protein